MAKAPAPFSEDTEAVRQWKQITSDFIGILASYAGGVPERNDDYDRMISGLRVMSQSLLAAIQSVGR